MQFSPAELSLSFVLSEFLCEIQPQVSGCLAAEEKAVHKK